MLYYTIVTLHVIVCVVLILVVLLQSGKGADLAGAFGGGGTQTAFGSRGPASFLTRMTTVAAVVFMITSITLSGVGSSDVSESVLDGTESPAIPAPTETTADPEAVTPTAEEIKRIQQEIESRQQQEATEKTKPPATDPEAKKKPEEPQTDQKP
jgi:preprotein translocase subunit SecG